MGYIRSNLLIDVTVGEQQEAQEEQEEEEELCILSPGLNTPHEPADKDIAAPQRALHYARVLQCLRFAHVHLGSSFDQDDFRIDRDSKMSKATLN